MADRLLGGIGCSRPGGFLLEGQLHTLMPAVLLRMSGLDAFDGDAELIRPAAKCTCL